MGEIRLDNCCRLCLKDGFSLTNIFSHSSAAGDPLYHILNFIYDTKISENDGLPSQICSPCMWRMMEFDACKRNVHSAEAEIMRLLTQIRPHINEVSNHGAVLVAKETEMDSAGEVGTEGGIVHCKAPVKEEINVLEWENPLETEKEEHIPEALQKFEEDDCDDLESTEVEADEVPAQSANQRVFCLPLGESSQSLDVPNALGLEDCDKTAVNIGLGESSSVTNIPENNMRIRVTSKRTSEKDLGDDVIQAQESLSAEQPKTVRNLSEPGPSHLEAHLSKVKYRFICDFCKKSFQLKYHLSRHIRVHYDDRQFSCSVCNKSFKQNNGRRLHELRHLRDTMSVGKSEKASKKYLFSCGICGKNFGSKSGLLAHSNEHSNKYSCSTCGRSFGSKTDLRRHSIVHTKEKPYECQNCFKSFNVKGNLTRHMASHSSAKPFSCTICKKKFKIKADKNLHELLHFRK